MFEARMPQAALLKKIIEAIKDLVTEANFDCSASGIQLQVLRFCKYATHQNESVFFSVEIMRSLRGLLTASSKFCRQWTPRTYHWLR